MRITSDMIHMLKRQRCFQGGSHGWWQYEWCHMRQVRQSHKNEDGSKVEVLLGSWDEEYHKRMYAEHQPDNGHSITHFYRDGDYCEEAGRNREVCTKRKRKERKKKKKK